MDKILITTTDIVPGKKIVKILGVVRGNTVRAKWFGKDIIAGFRNIFGGEIKEHTEMMTEAREQAIERMINEAKELKADAVVNIRFATSSIGYQSSAELLAYGTAVKLG